MKTSIIKFAVLLLAICGCVSLPDAPERDAALDPENPDYIAPSVTVVNGPVGDTIDVDRAVFGWNGNDYTEEYDYRLNGGRWSGWSTSQLSDLRELPEGRNVLEIRSRYVSGDVSPVPDSVIFWVNAVHGPALLTAPRRITAAPGETFAVDLNADEVIDLAFVRAVLTYDRTMLQFQSVTAGPLLAKGGGNAVVLEKETGDSLAISVMRFAGGHSAGVSGSGTVCTCRFTVIGNGTGSIALRKGSSEFREENADIELLLAGNCIVSSP